MGSLIRWLPLLVRLWRRAHVLVGASQSATTRSQMMVAFPVALGVALLGYLMPALASDAVAFALVSAAIGWAAPYVSRYVAYKDHNESMNPYIMLIAVRSDPSKAWYPYTGTIMDAAEEHNKQGLDSFGSIYDLETGKQVGTIKLQNCSDEQSNKAIRDFVRRLKAINYENPSNN